MVGMGFVYLLLILRRQGWLPNFIYDGLTLQMFPAGLRMIIPLTIGILVIALALARLSATLLQPFRHDDQPLAESLYQYSRRNRGPHIVALGGGTGLPTLLRGLKHHTSNITAIVTVADDGGSSGRLRQELGLLPPGDFRNNLSALSRDEALMTQLFQYRFGRTITSNSPSELQGHAFGNLLIAALTGITGSFDEALLATDRVLRMQGRVLPSTLEDVQLEADIMIDPAGTKRIIGESIIPHSGGKIDRLYLTPDNTRAYPPALQAILQADLIILGPGSLYTSILPNLLITDLAQALRHSRAPKVYICNIATQPGETDNFTLADHLAVLEQHSPNCVNIVLANNNLRVPPTTGGGHTLYVQPHWSNTATSQLITTDLVDEQHPWRHDSTKLAQAIIDLLTHH